MPGEWIKLRADLFTHPRFVRLCAELFTRNETVTDEALRRVTAVTKTVTEAVTLYAITRVWLAVNSHCKVVGADAVIPACDLDKIAGVEGFDRALRAVGWLEEGEHNTFVFPNFLEFNEPACVRGTARTNAERQRAWRRRHAAAKEDLAGCVTSVTKRNDREEEIREEKRSCVTPPTPSPAPTSANGQDFTLTAEGLAQAWCFNLTRRHRGLTADPLADMVPQFAELLRQGQDPARLLSAVNDPARDRGEYFWQFKDRLAGKGRRKETAAEIVTRLEGGKP